MYKGELKELCLKQTTTNKGGKQEFYEIELHVCCTCNTRSLCVGWLLTEMYLQIMYSLGSSNLILWDYHIRGQSLRLAEQLKI